MTEWCAKKVAVQQGTMQVTLASEVFFFPSTVEGVERSESTMREETIGIETSTCA